jgi:hypothetical protein
VELVGFAVVGRLPRVGGDHVVAVEERVVRGRLAGEHLLDHRLEAALLLSLECFVAFEELGQHLAGHELVALHDVLVAVAPGGRRQDEHVDAAVLVAPEVLTHLVGRPERAAQPGRPGLHHLGPQPILVRGRERDRLGVEARFGPPGPEVGPDIGVARLVPTEHVVVAERVAEEVRALRASPHGLLRVGMAHEAGDTREVRIHCVADRDAFVGERRVVVVDPGLRLFGVEERERQRADAVLRGEVDGVAPCARNPHRWVRLLQRLRNDVARRHRHVLPRESGERRLAHAPQRDPQALLPRAALLLGVDPERVELGGRRPLAGAELDPSARDDVERGDALGLARRMVDRRRRVHDPVPEPQVLRPLRQRGEEDLRRRRVAVLLEEVVLHQPERVDADRVEELGLLERRLEHPSLVATDPGLGHLVLVEHPELHRAKLRAPNWVTWHSPVTPSSSRSGSTRARGAASTPTCRSHPTTVRPTRGAAAMPARR